MQVTDKLGIVKPLRDEDFGGPEGLRERKRRETLQRIKEAGLELFVKNGYDATTLDAIAEAAGISRRTFFYYFTSKEQLLRAWQDTGFIGALRTGLLKGSGDQTPFSVVSKSLPKLVSRFESKESIVVDRLTQSSETLRTGKHAAYVQMEEFLFEALCERWPEPERKASLRMVAMVSIGVLRLALDAWRNDNGKQPLANHVRRAFATAKAEV